jgi:phage gpG-like protein
VTGFRDLSRRLASLDLDELKRAVLARAANRLADGARLRAGDAIPIGAESDGARAVIGAAGAEAQAREFGTRAARPRPFLAPAAAELGPEIVAEIAAEIAAEFTNAIAGRS